MWEHLNELVILAVTAFTGILTATGQRLYQRWKTRRFKLSDHRMFSDLVYSINDICSWNPVENRVVFIDALKIKLECWHDEGIKLAEELQKNNYSNLQLKNKVVEWSAGVITLYTNKWKSEKIPHKVITRINSVHQTKVKDFLREIELACYNNDMYPFKMQKIISIFDTLRLLLADTKNDFNTLVYRLKYNGDFTGCKYKGVPVSDNEFVSYNKLLKKEDNG